MSAARAGSDGQLAVFDEHHRYLFAVAYRMLGIAEDAEDVLQDAWIRFAGAPLEEIESPRAYLVTIVTRLSLDLLRSARRRREEYVGVWLPEPVVSREALPEELAEQAESASFAFLLLLERVGSLERVALVLHHVFDFMHEDIARMTGRTAAASRQTLRRARVKLSVSPSITRSTPPADGERLVGRFLDATAAGDVDRVMSILAPDVVLESDGGGVVRAINRPLAGRGEVGRFILAIAGMAAFGDRAELAELNGQPAIVTYEQRVLTNAMLFDATSAGVTAIYIVRNPHKLSRVAAAIGGRDARRDSRRRGPAPRRFRAEEAERSGDDSAPAEEQGPGIRRGGPRTRRWAQRTCAVPLIHLTSA